ncbi:glutaredoxin family protein [Variovorax sp. OV329]|uniref:glutaredoxin family protein n=1 Tax=Variovorax sp. OV329 TaxID=1882825 RepID=UPI0008EF9726|nr:glutaredoxin family protein [Variovorax sp. OV329]SFM40488.1 Glutaredoxin [Variovorax sp. OV329]
MKLDGRLGSIALAALTACAAGSAFAQQVYRQVDANGKVTYSDQAPTARNAQPVTGSRGGDVTSLPVDNSLPYELRQVAQRYPVTLYTRDECQPCDAARSLLTTRGVPFSEKTVQTAQDNDALQRQTGQNSLPLVAIGAQQLVGFQDSEWSRYLDAAGYPTSSRLPPSYRNAPASPLVAQVRAAPQAPAAAAPAAAPSSPPPPSTAGVPTPENPAGIRF